jgi:hypothetical protein
MAKWTRARRVRWLVAILVVAVIAALGAAVLVVQPDLNQARDRVDTAWSPLRAPLAARYATVEGVVKALEDGGFGARSVTKDLDAVYERWRKLALQGATHADAELEATTANELEAQMRRLGANIAAADRLKAAAAPEQPLGAAMSAFRQQVVSPPLVKSYNHAANTYEDQRSGTINKLVAGLLGYESRPRLLLG